ncbi:MAG TPA: ribosome biogenesis GTPase Der [Anaerolineae bacterium]|nr:ribosome biogenesis GTPase Der [Anaerolineae bacterium]HQI86622.1 ribosome biogenesis GTPase Der [Anaerolineae bacterium]
MAKPLIAIVGRPNVGKSTLFNRIVGERRAVVSDIPGTTRDRIIAPAEWNGVSFLVVDTGGIEVLPLNVDRGLRPVPDAPLLEDSVPFIPLIRAQAEIAIEEADLILFLTDATTGLTGADQEVADLLRRCEKPVLLIANKADNEYRDQQALEFYELGMGEVYPVSSIHGTGVADLLDIVVDMLPPVEPEAEAADEAVHVAILGRPNVGKSSLLNKLLGEERAIVSPVSGTTRDALDTEMEWEGRKVVLIDTAGIRRRGKIDPGVEKYSVLRAARALQRTDVALLLIDATEGITAQDTHVAGMIAEEGVSVVVVVNKWDAVDAETRAKRQEFEAQVREGLKFLSYIPVLFVSALTGLHVNQVMPAVFDVVEARYQRLPGGQVNDLIRTAMAEHPAPSKKGQRLKVFYVTQAEVAPPTFIFFVNDPELLHFSYQRFLENCIREAYPFPGTPIRMVFRLHQAKTRSKARK